MMFLSTENGFENTSRSGISGADVLNGFGVKLNCHSFCDQIVAQIFQQCFAATIFGMTAFRQAAWIEIRISTQLDDALCQHIGVLLFLLGMLQKFLLYCFCRQTIGNKVVMSITKDAYQFGSECLNEQCDDLLTIRCMALRYGPRLHIE